MTAHEDHPELVILNPSLTEVLVNGQGQRPLAVEVGREIGGERPAGALAANDVDARLRAAVRSHADGLFGIPRSDQSRIAAMKDSWTTSSASSRL